MPTKAAQVIAFIAVLTVSAALHRFVYANLKRVLLRDYPKTGRRLVRIARWLFLTMDAPFLYLYFRSGMPISLVHATTWLIYPFSVWQAIMIMWAVVLTPFALWRRTGAFGFAALRQRLERRKDEEQEQISFEPVLEVAAE